MKRAGQSLHAFLPAGILAALAAAGLPAQTPDELNLELKATKERLEELKKKIKKQEEELERLSTKKAVPGGPRFAALPGQAAEEKAEERPADTQAEMEDKITEKVLDRLQPAISASNKTFPSQFNPAIGLILDTAFSWKQNEQSNFEFRAAELGISASIDPFARGYAILNGSSEGFEVEEAAIVTTSLPFNLTAKGGRFFSDFGRLSKFHDHDLPFVNRPVVLDTFVGGESQSDGVEISYLTPLPQYFTITLGAYNKIGGENDRVDNAVPRDLSEFTYLVRPATFFNLNDSNGVDLGATYAFTPTVEKFADVVDDDLGTVTGTPGALIRTDRSDKPRHLAAVDLTYRYTPLSQASYRGFVWGTEVLYNQESWNLGEDPTLDPVFRGRDAWGLYTYAELRLTRRYYPGFLYDYARDLTRLAGDTKAYSPYFTIWFSEFNRLRLQYTYLDEPGNHESQFFVQWTAVLGSHVHGFRDR